MNNNNKRKLSQTESEEEFKRLVCECKELQKVLQSEIEEILNSFQLELSIIEEEDDNNPSKRRKKPKRQKQSLSANQN
jgi:signal recognition particle subunit SEC65